MLFRNASLVLCYRVKRPTSASLYSFVSCVSLCRPKPKCEPSVLKAVLVNIMKYITSATEHYCFKVQGGDISSVQLLEQLTVIWSSLH